ncbi:hypothetical protein JXB37_02360, partial [candidate division WOR-3 bacterium]|nr:hypothetical protein [candidate division WOR-3 bacterium]
MRSVRTVLFLLLVPLALAAQNADTMWVNVYDRGSCQDDYYANDIVRDPNNNIYVVGSMGITMGPTLRLTPGIIKYNQWGDSLWAYVWHPGISALDLENTFHAVALDSSGHVWGAGTRMHYIYPAFTYSFFVARLDTANPENNQKVRIMNWGIGDDRLFDIAVGPNGEVYACGACTDTMTTHSPPRLDTFSFFTVMRLHVTDSIRPLWTRRYVLDEEAFDAHGGLGPRLAARGRDRHPLLFKELWYEWTNAAVALDVNSSGELAVTGYGLHSSREYEAWTMKFDSTGNRLWEKADGGTLLDEDDAGFDVAMMENGRVVVCGFDDRGLYPDFAVYGYPSAGGDAYAKVQVDYDAGDDFAFAIAKDDATPQNVYVTGAAEMPAGPADWGYQFLTHKLEVTNLEQRWGSGGATWGDTLEDAFGYDVAWADGRVYVTGHDSGAVMMTLCYGDSSVSPKFEEWALSYTYPDSSDNSLGTTVCASDSDGVYVAGQSERMNPFLGSVMPVMQLFNDDRDLRADSLLAPNDTLVYGAAVAPRMRIVNEGNSRGLPVAYFRAGDGFADTVIVLNWMYPGDSVDVTFGNWTPAQMGPVAVQCSVALLGDVDNSNDFILDTVFVLRRDVG